MKVKISDNDLLNISDVIQKSSDKIEEEVVLCTVNRMKNTDRLIL